MNLAETKLNADFGRTSEDYARYRPGFPPSFFDRIEALGIGRAGQRILDLGTGTGMLARELARRGANVTGLDVSFEQITASTKLAAAAGVRVEYFVGKAEATGLPTADFDVVIAGQCWHWFDSSAAMKETTRLLKPDGRLVICHFDWISLPGNVVEMTEQLIQAHNPAWRSFGGSGIYPQWAVDAGRAGFRALEVFAYDHELQISHEAWRGRIRASAGVGASLAASAVARFDGELADLLRQRFPAEPLVVPHRVFALCATRPG